MLTFDSTSFPVADAEDEETNPGIFGKALAEWLSLRLNEGGVEAKPPFAEDWGWCIELANQKHRTGLACASEDGSKSTWRVYAFVELGLFGGFRGKDGSTQVVNGLIDKVRGILSNEATVTNLRTDEDA